MLGPSGLTAPHTSKVACPRKQTHDLTPNSCPLYSSCPWVLMCPHLLAPGDEGHLTIVLSVITLLLLSSPSQAFRTFLGDTHQGSGLMGAVQEPQECGWFRMSHCCNYGPKWLL